MCWYYFYDYLNAHCLYLLIVFKLVDRRKPPNPFTCQDYFKKLKLCVMSNFISLLTQSVNDDTRTRSAEIRHMEHILLHYIVNVTVNINETRF